jgi:hypothetical protein
MDPYLEPYWGDVHTRLMVYAVDEIQEQLPGDLLARVEEGVSIDLEDGRRSAAPDVQVIERPEAGWGRESITGTVAVAEPLIVPVDDPAMERHITIIDRSSGDRVVTVIEVLSPTNKIPGDGREKYRRKQGDYVAAGVNLVEIDLVRSGIFSLAVSPNSIGKEYRTPYRVCVRRMMRPNEAEIYRAPLREPLPAIPIPLRPTDRDVTVNLQALLDLCYHKGRYDSAIDYSEDPDPPLGPADARWADELLRAAGKRP